MRSVQNSYAVCESLSCEIHTVTLAYIQQSRCMMDPPTVFVVCVSCQTVV